MARGTPFGIQEVDKVLVIGTNYNQINSTFKKAVEMLESLDHGKKFFIKDVVVTFCREHLLAKEGYRL